MSSQQQIWGSSSSNPTPVEACDAGNWYAVQTRARHEKAVEERLLEQGIATFLPLVTEVHRWSDRRKTVQLPLFSCYLFAKLAAHNEHRQRVCRTLGVLRNCGLSRWKCRFPKNRSMPCELSWSSNFPGPTHPFLKIGQRVRVRGGSMDGVEGVLLARNGDRTLVISVDAIQRSLAVRIEGYDVEPL